LLTISDFTGRGQQLSPICLSILTQSYLPWLPPVSFYLTDIQRKKLFMKVSYFLFAAMQFLLLQPAFLPGQTFNAVTKPGGRTPVQVTNRSAQVMGAYDPAEKLRLVFALKRPKAEEEQTFLEALYTPGSPEYHKFLTAEQWNDRFAPSTEDEQAVVDWVTSQGLTVTTRYPNRLIVDVEAPVAQIQKTLSVNINRYQLNGATVFSNDRDPVIPAHLSGIIMSVIGLNNIQTEHSHLKSAKQITHPNYSAGPSTAVVGEYRANGDRAKLAAALKERKNRSGVTPAISPEGAYEPIDIIGSNAYDFFALNNLGHCCNPNGNPGGSPPETSIAIASAGSLNMSDLDGFRKQYPFLAFNVTVIHVDGTSTKSDPEGTLDVEWATTMGNSFNTPTDTAHVYIYEGANPQHGTFLDVYNQILTDGHARVMSTSWGSAEVVDAPPEFMEAENGVFAAMAAQGWTSVAAAGDGGSTTDCRFTFPTVDFPASSPNVIAAGGTSLRLDENSAYLSESAWTGDTTRGSCAINDGGGGGGFSAVFGVPFYQAFLGHGVRTLPDISLNASFFQTIFEGGSIDFAAGTSIVAPELAGFFAQENAYLLFLQTQGVPCFGNQACAPIGNANFYIYAEQQHAPGYAPHYPFYDITNGCNSNDVNISDPSSFYCATPGYDLATGLGSANMLQLAWAINYNAAGDFGPPSVKFSGPPVNKWYKTNEQVNMSFFDTTASPRPATGVAGFSLAWDKDPAPESFSKSTPGSNDAFYTGPQFPNQNRGVLILSSAGQGCHTAHAKAWDNTGTSSDLLSYGPICYDTIAPSTTAAVTGPTSGGAFSSSVKVTLSRSDKGSGVALTFYSTDGKTFSTYSAPFTFSAPSGTHTLTYYSQDVAGNVESKHTQSFIIKLPTTVTKVTSSLNPSRFGLNVTFTAKVTASSGGAPTGLVNFRDGSAVIGTASLSNGQAVLVTKALRAGSHAITAVYLGGSATGSTSAVLGEIVNKAATATTLASSLNPSSHGHSVTFTATVTSASAVTGTVTFKNGTALLGTAAVNTSTHKATFATSGLAAGTRSITAVYSGNTNLNGSISAALTQIVK
jgi:hypothetical protein